MSAVISILRAPRLWALIKKTGETLGAALEEAARQE